MKKIFFILSAVPFLCFGYTEDMTYLLDSSWYLHKKGMTKEAINLLTSLVESTEVPEIDKVHYINARSMFFYWTGMYEKSEDDKIFIENLKKENIEIYMEFQKYYD